MAAARHLGPMAQDFFSTFGLGRGETTIDAIDADGVAMASIQALRARSEGALARVAALETENDALAEQYRALEARLARIESMIGADDE